MLEVDASAFDDSLRQKRTYTRGEEIVIQYTHDEANRYVYKYRCMYMCGSQFVSVSVPVLVSICVRVFAYVHVCLRMCAYIYMCICMYVGL